MPSPNYSSRGGAAVRLIVLHTAEGARTIESLGNFFASSSSGVSSQVGIDDKANTVGEYVRREHKSWTQGQFNPVATSAELCAFAAWDAAEWSRHPNMLANCAAWIAEEAAHFGIPIVELSSAAAQSSGAGVCQHIDLGAAGGGHVDCGPAFPIDQVLEMAAGRPSSPDIQEVPTMPVAIEWQDQNHVFYVTPAGRLEHRWQGIEAGDWFGETMAAGLVASSTPEVIAEAGRQLDVYANQADGGLGHWWTQPGVRGWGGESI
jgi:hypothetical protein